MWMKIEEISKLWEEDSKIDITNLHLESINIPSLHNKYYKFYISEKVRLKKYKADYNKLKFDKYEFYTLGPNEETEKLGWELPPRGRILKGEVERYLEADQDIINLTLKIGICEEKIEYLKSIIQLISNRTFQCKNALDFLKFQNAVS